MTILITNPNYDLTTSYLFHYTKEVIDFAKGRGFDVIYLIRPRLNREVFSNFIFKKNPLFLLLNGHGNDAVIFGDKIDGVEESLVEEGVNHYLLEGRLVYARSCWSACSLGKECTKKSGCFIGYEVPFQFWVNENLSATPLKDETAKLFLEPSNILAKSLIKGNTAKQAVEISKQIYKKHMLHLLNNKEELGTMRFIRSLWNNMEGLVILGDKEMIYS